MNNAELQEVVDSILQAMLEMEKRINTKFDSIGKKLNSLETEIENLEDAVLDVAIVEAKVNKHEREIKKLKSSSFM